jgi:hypothetical protein
MLPSLAEAQAIPRGEAARGVTVANRAREDFDPLGVRLGSWRINAAADLGVGYDSNLFGTQGNRTSDGFGILGAEAGAQSDWSSHALGVTGRVEQRSYFNESSQDWTDYAVGIFGRYDLTPDTSVAGRVNRVQSHLDASSLDVQEAGLARPVPYTYTEVQAEAQTRLNRVGMLVLGNWRGYQFQNVDAGPPVAPGQLPPGEVSIYDFNSAIGAIGLNYEIGPGRFLNLIGRYQDITYQDSSQRPRDSKTVSALVGFTYDFDGIWGFRGAIGYLQRDYTGQGLKNLSAPTFDAAVTWQPTQLTTVTGGLLRTVEESIRANAVSYTRTAGLIRVDHEYLRNVILGAEAGFAWLEYEQPSQQATDVYGILSARWLINRNFSLVASYQYIQRVAATAGIEEYDRNLLQLRLRMAL